MSTLRVLGFDIQGGRWRPALGNSDAHLEDQIGMTQTVVLAEELSTGAVLDGIRAGRSWIAESATVELSFKAAAGDQSAGIGGRLEIRGEPIVIVAEVRGVPSGAVSFHTDRGAVHRAPLPSSESATVEWHTSDEESQFVRIEVRHSEGRMAALTNPIPLT
jgi:hypothetical protein